MDFKLKLLATLPLFMLLLADEVIETVEIYYTYSLDPTQNTTYSSSAPTTPNNGCQCSFPQDLGLVPITPHLKNGGWAISPDQQCSCGSWCPYACPAGFQSTQWNTRSEAGRMDGGLYCDSQGNLQKGREAASMCRDVRGEVTMRNTGRQDAHVCQTVFPGSESMLIPNRLSVNKPVQIAIPDQGSYQAPGTSEAAGAHFYVNPHGTSKETACSWGSKDVGPYGNWAPFVVGINRASDGKVYLALSWNPVYLEWATPFRMKKPNYGLRVSCLGGGCNNADCAIDPSAHGVNEVAGSRQGFAEPGGKGPPQAFCVTTVPQGGQAEILVFES